MTLLIWSPLWRCSLACRFRSGEPGISRIACAKQEVVVGVSIASNMILTGHEIAREALSVPRRRLDV